MSQDASVQKLASQAVLQKNLNKLKITEVLNRVSVLFLCVTLILNF